jgi:BASS family bile acid:Na+ symporter
LQNAGLGIFIAASVMQSPAMTVPSVVYALLMNAGAIGFVILMRGMDSDSGGVHVKAGG